MPSTTLVIRLMSSKFLPAATPAVPEEGVPLVLVEVGTDVGVVGAATDTDGAIAIVEFRAGVGGGERGEVAAADSEDIYEERADRKDDEAVVSNGRLLGNAVVPGMAVGTSKLGEEMISSRGEPKAWPEKMSVPTARAAMTFMASCGTCNQRW